MHNWAMLCEGFHVKSDFARSSSFLMWQDVETFPTSGKKMSSLVGSPMSLTPIVTSNGQLCVDGQTHITTHLFNKFWKNKQHKCTNCMDFKSYWLYETLVVEMFFFRSILQQFIGGTIQRCTSTKTWVFQKVKKIGHLSFDPSTMWEILHWLAIVKCGHTQTKEFTNLATQSN